MTSRKRSGYGGSPPPNPKQQGQAGKGINSKCYSSKFHVAASPEASPVVSRFYVDASSEAPPVEQDSDSDWDDPWEELQKGVLEVSNSQKCNFNSSKSVHGNMKQSADDTKIMSKNENVTARARTKPCASYFRLNPSELLNTDAIEFPKKKQKGISKKDPSINTKKRRSPPHCSPQPTTVRICSLVQAFAPPPSNNEGPSYNVDNLNTPFNLHLSKNSKRQVSNISKPLTKSFLKDNGKNTIIKKRTQTNQNLINIHTSKKTALIYNILNNECENQL
jgi:hypothetical protein